jgi:HSP20 family protein
MNDKDHYSGDDETPDRIMSIDELIEHIMEMFSDSIKEEDGKTVIRGFTVIGQPGKKPTIFGFSGLHEDDVSDYEEEDETDGDFYIFKQEPFIDVFETDDKLVVLADLGVEEKNVEYYPYCSHVELTVITKDTGYSRVIDLPCGVDPETMVATYNNGVLELTFELVADEE